jgi:hypothetical protein
MKTADRFLWLDNEAVCAVEICANTFQRSLPSRSQSAARASYGNLRGNCNVCRIARSGEGKVMVQCLGEKPGFLGSFAVALQHRFLNSHAKRCAKALFLDRNAVLTGVSALTDVAMSRSRAKTRATESRPFFPVASGRSCTAVGFTLAGQSLECRQMKWLIFEFHPRHPRLSLFIDP